MCSPSVGTTVCRGTVPSDRARANPWSLAALAAWAVAARGVPDHRGAGQRAVARARVAPVGRAQLGQQRLGRRARRLGRRAAVLERRQPLHGRRVARAGARPIRLRPPTDDAVLVHPARALQSGGDGADHRRAGDPGALAARAHLRRRAPVPVAPHHSAAGLQPRGRGAVDDRAFSRHSDLGVHRPRLRAGLVSPAARSRGPRGRVHRAGLHVEAVPRAHGRLPVARTAVARGGSRGRQLPTDRDHHELGLRVRQLAPIFFPTRAHRGHLARRHPQRQHSRHRLAAVDAHLRGARPTSSARRRAGHLGVDRGAGLHVVRDPTRDSATRHDRPAVRAVHDGLGVPERLDLGALPGALGPADAHRGAVDRRRRWRRLGRPRQPGDATVSGTSMARDRRGRGGLARRGLRPDGRRLGQGIRLDRLPAQRGHGPGGATRPAPAVALARSHELAAVGAGDDDRLMVAARAGPPRLAPENDRLTRSARPERRTGRRTILAANARAHTAGNRSAPWASRAPARSRPTSRWE